MKVQLSVFLSLFIYGFPPLMTYAVEIPEESDSFYVNDTAEILADETEQVLIDLNADLYEKYEVQFVIVTIDDLPNADIESFAYETFAEYDIGNDDTNRGLLLVIDKNNENYWLMPGTGLQHILTPDILSNLLYQNLEEEFKTKNYDTAILNFSNALDKQLSDVIDHQKSEELDLNQSESQSGINFVSMVATVLLIIFSIAIVLPLLLKNYF